MGLAAFAAVALPEAHAAPGPLLGADVLDNFSSGLFGGFTFDALFGTTGLCMESMRLDTLLDLEGHDPGTTHCSSVQGVGYALLALVALVVVALGRLRMQTEQKRLDLAQRLIEQGIEPPPGLLMGPARNDLRKGIVLLFAGAGLFVSGLFVADRGLAAGGLVPEFIGIGYLVSFWLASREPGGER